MPELNVPDAGLQLEGPNSETLSGVPRQAFPVEISHSVIEDMIRFVQDGQEIQLSLGSAPAFIYGPNMHHISPVPDSFPYDLYLTKPFEGLRKAQKLATTMSILKTPKDHAAAQAVRPPTTRGRPTKGPPKPKPQAQNQAQTQTQPKKARARDSGFEALQSSLATAGAGKTQAATLGGSGSSGRSGGGGGDKGPGPKRGSVKAMGTVSSARTTPNSHASSPNPNGQPSPSMNPTPSASQRAVERAREQRFTLVHELAVQEQTKDYLRSKWTGKADDFLAALEKAAEPAPDPAKYRMTERYWRELDVHVYDYATQAERQTAINNAVRQYDKMRLSQSDPLWDRLLPRDERGKGKCLSVLQAKLATGAGSTTANVSTPAIKVQSADDSMADAPTRDDSLFGDDRPGRSGGAAAGRSEPMSRSNSQPLPARAKRMTGSEAQAKRLLSTTTKRMAVTKNSALGRAGREKPAAPAPARDRAPAGGGSGGSGASGSNGSGGGSSSKTLSAEIIEDSDSDGHVPLSKGKAVSTTARMAAAAAPPAAKPAAARPQSAKPAPRPQPAKRRREDEEEAAVDDSSSNSSTPLSKRLKAVPRPKLPASGGTTTTTPAAAARHRPSGASSQGSRPATARPGSSAAAAARNGHHGAAAAKSTATATAATTGASPAKSSPLATSSATNPSDVDDSERGRPAQKPGMKRRKMEPARPAASTTTTSRAAAKKPAQLPRELVSKAVRFRGLYAKYAELHRKVGGMENPSASEMNSLHDMHSRLEILKRDIYLEAGDARA